jgi:hypothetical protein
MTTIAEIEDAIEDLPAPQVTELAQWLEDYRMMLSASADVFAMLDAEEGGGDQWSEPDRSGERSGS